MIERLKGIRDVPGRARSICLPALRIAAERQAMAKPMHGMGRVSSRLAAVLRGCVRRGYAVHSPMKSGRARVAGKNDARNQDAARQLT